MAVPSFILFLVSLSCVSALFESSTLIKQKTAAEMRELVQNPDYLTVVMIYDVEGSNSIAVAPVMEQVADRYRHFFKFIGVDCTYDEQVCPEKMKEYLPALTAYVPAGLNPYTGKPLIYTRDYQGSVSLKDIGDFLIKNMVFLGDVLDLENEEGFFADKELNKVVLFSDKQTVPPLFKGLSSKFRGRLDFGVVFKNQTELLDEHKVSAFPTVLVITPDGTEEYEGSIHFEDLSEFLDIYASETKHEPRNRRKPTSGSGEESTKSRQPQQSDLPDFSPVKASGSTFNDLLDDHPKLALVQFRQGKGLDEWKSVAQMFEGVVFLMDLDCENDAAALAIARKQGVKKFPSMRLFPINRKRKSFEINVDDDIEDEIAKELKYDIQTVGDANLNGYIKLMNEEDKVGCLFMSDQPIPLAIKGIGSDPHFKDSIRIAFYNKRNPDIIQNMNAKRFPTLITFIAVDDQGSLRLAEYTGDLTSFPQIFYFLDQVVLPALGKKKEKIEDEDAEEEEIEMWKPKTFASHCVKKAGICVFAFLDGDLVTVTTGRRTQPEERTHSQASED